MQFDTFDSNTTTVNILGTTYTIKLVDMGDDTDGECDYTNKTIRVRKNNINNVGNFDYLQRKALRHEIIHAFMAESGLGANWEHCNQFGHEETVVDWFAIQYHKINEVFMELNINC